MANPYSQPSKFTYTPLPLEKFAELAQMREAEYNAANDLMSNVQNEMLFREGNLTQGLANTLKSEYDKEIMSVAEDLMQNKNARDAGRKIFGLKNKYLNDIRVQEGIKDYEMSPQQAIERRDNAGGYFGYLNDDGSFKTFKSEDLRSGSVANAYANAAAAPTFEPELKYWNEVDPKFKEWITHSKARMDPNNPGNVLYYDEKGVEVRKNINELLDDPQYNVRGALKTMFDKSQGSSNFYKKSGKGYGAYEKDVISMLMPMGMNKVTKDEQILNDPYAGAKAKAAATAGEELLSPTVSLVEGNDGSIKAKVKINPDNPYQAANDYQKVQNHYDELYKQDPRKALEYWNSTEAKATRQSYNYLKQKEASFAADEGNKIWENKKNELAKTLGKDIKDIEKFIAKVEDRNSDAYVYDEYAKTRGPHGDGKVLKDEYAGIRDFMDKTNKEVQEKFTSYIGSDKMVDNRVYHLQGMSPDQINTYKAAFSRMFNTGSIDVRGVEVFRPSGDGLTKVDWSKGEPVTNNTNLINSLHTFLKENPNYSDPENVSIEVAEDGTYLVLDATGTLTEDGRFIKGAAADTGQDTYTFRTKINDKAVKDAMSSNGVTNEIEYFLDLYTSQVQGIGSQNPMTEEVDATRTGMDAGKVFLANSYLGALGTANVDKLNFTGDVPTQTGSKQQVKMLTDETKQAFMLVNNELGNQTKQAVREAGYLFLGEEMGRMGEGYFTMYMGKEGDYDKNGKPKAVTHKDIYNELTSLPEDQLEQPENEFLVYQMIKSLEENHPSFRTEEGQEALENLNARKQTELTLTEYLEELNKIGNIDIDKPFYFTDKAAAQSWTAIPQKKNSNETLAVRNLNPGNIRDPKTGEFVKFNSWEEGVKGLENQLITYKTDKSKTGVKSNSTLLETMSIYAPKEDSNDPVAYTNYIVDFFNNRGVNITKDTPISQIDTKLWSQAIASKEDGKAYSIANSVGAFK